MTYLPGIIYRAVTVSKSANYTLTLSDANNYIRMGSGSPITLTVPTNSTAAIPINTEISVEQSSAGVLTVAAAPGVTILGRASLVLAGQYAVARLKKIATDIWVISGDLIPASPLISRNYATRVDVPDVLITGGALGGTTHLRHKNMVAFTRIKCVIPLFYGLNTGPYVTDVDLAGNVTIACSIEYPANTGTRYSFMFSGVRNPTTTAAAVGGYLVSDWLDLPVTIPAATNFGTYTFIQVTSGNPLYSNVFTGGSSNGGNEGFAFSASPVDSTVSGTVTDGFSFGFGPMLLLTEGTIPSVAIWGDSIAKGQNDNASGDGNGNRGWISKYLYRDNKGYSKFAIPGEKMTGVDSTRWQRRLAVFGISGATHVISRYGTNDITTAQQTTLSGMQAAKAAELALYDTVLPGLPKIGTTCTPRTSTSDNWATTINQSVTGGYAPAGTSLREQYNDWLRTVPSPFASVFDTETWTESGLNTGLWVVNGSANYATPDGTHPQPAIHTLIANNLPLGVIT